MNAQQNVTVRKLRRRAEIEQLVGEFAASGNGAEWVLQKSGLGDEHAESKSTRRAISKLSRVHIVLCRMA